MQVVNTILTYYHQADMVNMLTEQFLICTSNSYRAALSSFEVMFEFIW